MDLKYSYLFDYYGELFTDKQKEYFTDYYFNNLTLQEIADNNNVSRNAVHKNIKDILVKLDYYEEKLKLYSNKQAGIIARSMTIDDLNTACGYVVDSAYYGLWRDESYVPNIVTEGNLEQPLKAYFPNV